MASDGRAGRTIQVLDLTILPDPDNAPPVLSTQLSMDMAVTEGRGAALDLGSFFSDPDGDALEYFVADLPFGTGLELYASGELKGTPSFADATAPQPLVVRVMASDGKASVVGQFRISVDSNPDNRAPVSATISPQEGVEGTMFLLDLGGYFDDDDQMDVLDYFVAGLPFGSGLTLYSTGVLSGHLSAADALAEQPLSIKILASDGQASTQQNFQLTVAPDLQARAVAEAEAKAAAVEGQGQGEIATPKQAALELRLGTPADVKLAPYFSGRLTGALSYSAEGLVAFSGLAVDAAAGVLYGVPNPMDLQTSQPITLTVTATAQNGQTEQQSIELTINKA